jgi:dienelactone hydrolase
MWPLLGQYALEGGRVLDWAQERFAFDGPILAGGVSMGGDATVALAGLDSRISRVAVLAATPDWTRPGMRTIGEPDGVIDQGLPDFYARWFFDQLDPLTHLDRYAKGAAVAFECGAIDQHVPAEAAVRFRDRLRELAPTATVRVTLHAGLDHVGACRSEALYERAGDWLTAPADRNGS